MPQFVSPTGSPIIGTKELIPGVALVASISETGEPEYEGETDVDWDGQRTVKRDGKILFVDDDGEQWTFDQLTKVEDDEDGEDDESEEG